MDDNRLPARVLRAGTRAAAFNWRRKVASDPAAGDTGPGGSAADGGRRILLVAYHFYPDTAVGAKRVSELARHLCRQGHEVVVVTASAPDIVMDPALALTEPQLRCIRVPQPPKLVPALLKRLKRLRPQRAAAAAEAGSSAPAAETFRQRLKRWYHSLEWLVDDKKLWATLVAGRLLALAAGRRFDAVISSGPPMSAHLAVRLARPVLRARWVMDLRDPWSDQDHWRLDLQSGLSRFLNRRLERWAVGGADAVTATTSGYTELLRARYPARSDSIQLVLNGFDGEIESSPPPQGRLALLYAGSLYYNRDPFPLLEAVRRLVERPEVDRSRVAFRLVGRCESWNGRELGAWIRRHGLEDCVSVQPPVSPDEVRGLMVQANVLVNFAQGQPMQIPAKMFDYIAARRDVLLMTEPDSATAWVAGEAGCARVVPPGDQAALDAALTAYYDKYVHGSGRADLDVGRLRAYSRAVQNARFQQLLTGAPVAREAGA